MFHRQIRVFHLSLQGNNNSVSNNLITLSIIMNEKIDIPVDTIYLLTAIGLSPGGSSTVHIYTQTIHRTIRNKQYIELHNNFGRVRAVPRLG